MNTIIFDMDGTLADSDELAAHAAEDGLRIWFTRRGLPVRVPSRAHRRSLVGLPSLEYFSGLLPPEFRDEGGELREIVWRFEVERLARGEGRFFPGVAETLRGLRASGWRIGLVSNCGRGYFDGCLEHLGLAGLVDNAFCLDEFPTKIENVRQTLLKFGATGGVMVGDRAADLEAGKANGLRTVGCRYGYGSPEELDGADAHLDAFSDLPGILSRLA